MNWRNQIFRIFSLTSIILFFAWPVGFIIYAFLGLKIANYFILIDVGLAISLFVAQFILFILMKERDRSDKRLFIISLSVVIFYCLIFGVVLLFGLGPDNY